MIILGLPLVAFDPLYRVTTIEEIQQSKPNCTVLLDNIDEPLVQYIQKQDISFALHVESIKDACIANAIGAKYIIVPKKLSKKAQDIATEYLFDTKILILIEHEDEIEHAASDSIDGVIFTKAIV